MSKLESTTLEQQCAALLKPLLDRARQGDKAAIQPTEEGAALMAAIAAKFKDEPMSGAELDVMYLIPQDKWPDGLEDKVEALLEQSQDD